MVLTNARQALVTPEYLSLVEALAGTAFCVRNAQGAGAGGARLITPPIPLAASAPSGGRSAGGAASSIFDHLKKIHSPVCRCRAGDEVKLAPFT